MKAEAMTSHFDVIPAFDALLNARFAAARMEFHTSAPEIQLLYKSKSIRPKDQTDFDTVIGLLDKDARAWLRKSLAIMSPYHAWLSSL
jgi:hypothetical protein